MKKWTLTMENKRLGKDRSGGKYFTLSLIIVFGEQTKNI